MSFISKVLKIRRVQPHESVHHLRKLQVDDAEWIFAACQDHEIQRWTTVPRPYLREHADSFVDSHGSAAATFAIVHSPTSKAVGVIGVHEVRDGVASVGYWVAPWGRGCGAASDALRLLKTVLSDNSKVHSIRALIAETNKTSRRTAERAGLTLTGPDDNPCPDGDNQVIALRYERLIR